MRRHDEGGELETKEPRMPITMYDLAGAEADRRFSPFCWRSKMALAHKGLAVETVPWRFTEKDKLPQPNAGRVPVIIDGDRVVHDSTVIADYLEERYPDRPSLCSAAQPGERWRLRAELDRNGIADRADPSRHARHPSPLRAAGSGLFPPLARGTL
jgi:glutathione S-transferase